LLPVVGLESSLVGSLSLLQPFSVCLQSFPGFCRTSSAIVMWRIFLIPLPFSRRSLSLV
jgi:hypothetical protein